MNTSPEASVQLSFEQQQAISVAQKLLGNLQTETDIAANLLTSTRKELENITKEKTYQQELLDGLVQRVSNLQTDISSANSELTDIRSKHSALTNEIAQKTNQQDVKDSALKARESQVEIREQKALAKEIAVNKAAQTLEEDKKVHKEKVTRLQEVLGSI